MQTNHSRNYAMAERVNDVLMVSSFALWAMVLGFAPVLTYRLLVS
jgi:hypothetical protein